MTAVDPLIMLRSYGATLSARGNRLRIDAPEGMLSPELGQAIRTHKPALLDLLEAFGERAALMEYAGGLPRATARAPRRSPPGGRGQEVSRAPGGAGRPRPLSVKGSGGGRAGGRF